MIFSWYSFVSLGLLYIPYVSGSEASLSQSDAYVSPASYGPPSPFVGTASNHLTIPYVFSHPREAAGFYRAQPQGFPYHGIPGSGVYSGEGFSAYAPGFGTGYNSLDNHGGYYYPNGFQGGYAHSGSFPYDLHGGYPQNSLNGGYPQNGLNGGYPQNGLNGGYPQNGLNGGYPQNGLNGGYPLNGFNGGYSPNGFSGGYSPNGFSGGYLQSGFNGGYQQSGFSGGYSPNGFNGGYQHQGLQGGYLQNGVYGGGYQQNGLNGRYSQSGFTGVIGLTRSHGAQNFHYPRTPGICNRPNEILAKCGRVCTCEELVWSGECQLACSPGAPSCFCIEGFVRNRRTGLCIPQGHCQNCGPNEVLARSGSVCQCSDFEHQPAGSLGCADAKTQFGQTCFCQPGFARDDRSGKCIKEDQCPKY